MQKKKSTPSLRYWCEYVNIIQYMKNAVYIITHYTTNFVKKFAQQICRNLIWEEVDAFTSLLMWVKWIIQYIYEKCSIPYIVHYTTNFVKKFACKFAGMWFWHIGTVFRDFYKNDNKLCGFRRTTCRNSTLFAGFCDKKTIQNFCSKTTVDLTVHTAYSIIRPQYFNYAFCFHSHLNFDGFSPQESIFHKFRSIYSAYIQ